MSDDSYPLTFELAGLGVHFVDSQQFLRVAPVDEDHRLLHETITADDCVQLDLACDAILRDAQSRALEGDASIDSGVNMAGGTTGGPG